MKYNNRSNLFAAGFLLLLITVLAACNLPPAPSAPAPQAATGLPPSQTSPPTHTAPPAPTSTATHTPLPTNTPTITPTPTETFTPTPSVPFVSANVRAFCRYGPGKAYLYSYELKKGAQALVEGRNLSGTWLWLQPPDLNRHCWAAASVLDVTGDIRTVPVVQTRLPRANDLYGPPQNIRADRDGDEVTITWNAVWMTEDDDRGYLIEAFICQQNALVWVAVQTYETSYQFIDQPGCSQASSGKIYTVEKHGYVDPVPIPWP